MVVIDLVAFIKGVALAFIIFYGILWGVMFIGWLSRINQDDIEQWVRTHVGTSKKDICAYLFFLLMMAPGIYFWIME